MKGFIKKSGIYFDTKVKKGSNNAVTSDAVAKAIEEGGGGGGGGGSTDYADLTNKPKINNVELTGNKTLADLGIASSGDLSTLSSRVTQAESDIGNLSELATTEKTSLVDAINEVFWSGGGGSSGGLKFFRFASKATNSSVTISNVQYATFTRANIITWFGEAPTDIHAIIAMRNGGTNVKVALMSGTSFVMEQSSNPITYDWVGVLYE